MQDFETGKEGDRRDNMIVNEDPQGLLQKIRCFALDMDGTVYLGEQWIDGAKDFLKKIEESGRQYLFLTNNSSKSAEVYIKKLQRMGLEITEDRLVTSGHATAAYLKEHYAGKKVYLLGNELLKKEFLDFGIFLEEDNPEVVVTAFDTTLDYKKLCRVCDLVRKGLPYLATHPDYNCPTETGFVPDIGAIHAFIHASAGRSPDLIIGKPNREIIEYALKKAGVKAEETAMVGDRLYTDIAAGVKNGLTGILVLSGESTLETVERSEVRPHLIFDSVKEMMRCL